MKAGAGLGVLLVALSSSVWAQDGEGLDPDFYVVREEIDVSGPAVDDRSEFRPYTYDETPAPVSAAVEEDRRTKRVRRALEEPPDHLRRLLLRSGRVVHIIGHKVPVWDPNRRQVNGGLWSRWYQAPLRVLGAPSGVSLPKGDIYVRRGPRLRLPAAMSFVIPVALPGDLTARHEIGHAISHLLLLSHSRELLDLCGAYRGSVGSLPAMPGRNNPCAEFAAETYRQFWRSPKSRRKLPPDVRDWVARFEWDVYTGKYDGVAIAQSLLSRKDTKIGRRVIPGNARLKYAYGLAMHQFPWSELAGLSRFGARLTNFYDMTFRAWQSMEDFERHGSLLPRLEAIVASSPETFPTRRQDVHIQALCGSDMRWHPFNYLLYGSRANDQGQAGCVYLWGPTPEALRRLALEQSEQTGDEQLRFLAGYPWPRVDKNEDLRPQLEAETLHYIPEPLSRRLVRSILREARRERRARPPAAVAAVTPVEGRLSAPRDRHH